jgi:hypothetical protein
MRSNSSQTGLSAHEVKALMTSKPDTILIDLLPPEHLYRPHPMECHLRLHPFFRTSGNAQGF